MVIAARASYTSNSSDTSLTSNSSDTSLTSLTLITTLVGHLAPDSRPRSRDFLLRERAGRAAAGRTIKGGGGSKENERAGARGEDQRTI